MAYLSIFTISFTIALSGALAPGPLLTAVISESTKHGFKSGPLMILGHALLEIVLIILMVLGFTHFVNNPGILKIISLVGAAILIYFGIKMISSLPSASLDSVNNYKKTSNLVMLGITMSAANPYWMIWWLSIGLSLVLGAKHLGITGIVIFFAGHILADLGWYSIVSLAVSKGKRFLSDKIYKGILFICAIILIMFGIYFGFNFLRQPS